MLIPRIEVLAYVMQKGIIATETNISLRNSILKLRAVRNQESLVSYGGSSLLHGKSEHAKMAELS